VAVRSFNAEWMTQGLFFCEIPGLRYGLMQPRGGPCGALAAVQAEALRHLYYSDRALFGSSCAAEAIAETGDDGEGWSPVQHASVPLEPTPADGRRAVILAVTDIIWRARGSASSPAVVAVSGGAAATSGTASLTVSGVTVSYQPDGLTERLSLFECPTRAAVAAAVEANYAAVSDAPDPPLSPLRQAWRACVCRG
jgi:hypothetical protein